MNAEPLRNLTPFSIRMGNTGPIVNWCRLEGQTFTEPFFAETINHLSEQAGFEVTRSDIRELIHEASVSPGIPPSGFIFHMSRCGSTLVSRMLSQLNRNLVISEADPILQTLYAGNIYTNLSWILQVQWLYSVINVMGRPQTREQSQYFVKFTSWNITYLELIQAAFPDVPWVFVFRDPKDVLVSLSKDTPTWIEQLDTSESPFLEKAAKKLGEMCRSALDGKGRRLYVPYSSLPDAVYHDIADFFQLDLSHEEKARMKAISGQHSKKPNRAFTTDNREKALAVTDEIREYAREYVEPHYQALCNHSDTIN